MPASVGYAPEQNQAVFRKKTVANCTNVGVQGSGMNSDLVDFGLVGFGLN